MRLKDLKKFISEIPESMEDAEVYYVDFSGHGAFLKLRIDSDEGATITDGYQDRDEYLDDREKE